MKLNDQLFQAKQICLGPIDHEKDAENVVAWRYLYEGRMREFLHRDGKRYDLIFMGILHSEWQEQNDR